MTITDKYEFETVSYGTTGWNALLTTLMNQIEAFLHTRSLGVLGEAVSAYQALFLKDDGEFYKALADGDAWPCIALAVEAGDAAGTIRLHRHGLITNVAWAWTPGLPIYLSSSVAGTLTQVEPPEAIRQMVGFAESATSIYFVPYLGGASVDDGSLSLSVNTEILSDDKELTSTDESMQFLDPDGTDRNIELPAVGTALGLLFFISNTGTTGNLDFWVDSDLLGTFSPGDAGLCFCNGVNWEIANWLSPQIKTITLNAGLSDGEYSGIVEAGIAGAALAFGELCYLAFADSRWELAKGDAAATSGGKLGMCVLAAASDGDATKMLLYGNIRADSKFPSLTVGGKTYSSAATAGEIVATAPTGTTDFVVRVVGYGNTENELFYCPSNDYVTITGS